MVFAGNIRIEVSSYTSQRAGGPDQPQDLVLTPAETPVIDLEAPQELKSIQEWSAEVQGLCEVHILHNKMPRDTRGRAW